MQVIYRKQIVIYLHRNSIERGNISHWGTKNLENSLNDKANHNFNTKLNAIQWILNHWSNSYLMLWSYENQIESDTHYIDYFEGFYPLCNNFGFVQSARLKL